MKKVDSFTVKTEYEAYEYDNFDELLIHLDEMRREGWAYHDRASGRVIYRRERGGRE